MKKNTVIPIERIVDKIYLICGEKVMFDSDLAELYGVQTMRLNEQVKRNLRRFPEDFMFQLSQEEFINLKSQIAISSWGGRRTLPYVFTEQGVAMLSSVLNSDRAIDVNVAVIRTFVRLRNMLASHKSLAKKVAEHDKQITDLYSVVGKLLAPKAGKKNQIGYIWDKKP